MSSNLVYGFMDESPSLHDKAFFFCVGILLTSDPDEKHYKSLFKRIREKILNRKLRKVPEIKFSKSTEQVRRRVLKTIAKLPIKAIIYVVDTKGRRVADTPENYGIVIGFSIVEVLKFYKAIILTVDKKFTNQRDQTEVEKIALKVVAKKAEKGILDFKTHTESHKNSLLQIADFIAGAYHYKYNLKEDTYSNMIKHLIIEEKIADWIKMKAYVKKRIVNP